MVRSSNGPDDPTPWATAQEAIAWCDADAKQIGVLPSLQILNKAYQQTAWKKGNAKKAIDSMFAYPDDAQVQKSCAKMISAAGQFNAHVSRYLAVHNATAAIVNAAKRLPSEHQMDMLARVAGISDLSLDSQMHFQQDGGFELAVQIAEENAQDCGVLGEFLCLVSTMLGYNENLPRWISLGLGKQIIHAMKTCPSAGVTRGEAIWDLKMLFMVAAMFNQSASANVTAFRSELVDAGFIEQLVDTLRRDPSMLEQHRPYDLLGQDGSTLGSLRMTTSALEVLAFLGELNATHCEIIRDSGALEQVGEALDRYGDLKGTTPWGRDLSLVDSACPALQKLDKTCGKGTSFSSVREKIRKLYKKPEPDTFAVGDRVYARDSEKDAAKPGTVTSVSPLEVLTDEFKAIGDSFSFKFVTKEDPQKNTAHATAATACDGFLSS
jgi:hypothetical protein